MLSLSQIESDLTTALKARDALAADTLRGLKTAVQNQQIAKMADLSEDDIMAIVKREVKKRKEAATAFSGGGRVESAEKELKEAVILEKYLPQQMSLEELGSFVDKTLSAGSFSAKDFGTLMAKLKVEVGNSADGASLAKLLKEKLK